MTPNDVDNSFFSLLQEPVSLLRMLVRRKRRISIDSFWSNGVLVHADQNSGVPLACDGPSWLVP